MATAQRVKLSSLPVGTILRAGTYLPAGGATAFVYQHGTTTGATVYAAETGGGVLAQPLTADLNGQLPGWVADGQDLDVVATFAGVTASAAQAEPEIASLLVTRSWLPVNVRDPQYGAKGDGVTDDTAAIAAADAAVAANPGGGQVYFPRGVYLDSGTHDHHGANSVVWKGEAGRSAGANPTSIVKYTGTGTAPYLNFKSSQGCGVEDLGISATSASFTGNLIDFSHDSGLGTDSGGWNVERCLLNMAATSAGALIYADRAINGEIRGNNLLGGRYAIQGVAVTAHYSNAITIIRNSFSGQGTAQISGPGQGWAIIGNTFEPLAGGTAGAIDAAFSTGSGVQISGNWFGDTTGAGTQIIAGSGYQITGNFIAGTAGSTTGVSLPAGVTGTTVTGNTILKHNIGISIATTATDCYWFPNFYSTCTTHYTAPTGSVGANAGTGASVSLGAGASDYGGALVVTTGTGPTAGALITVNFASTRSTPRVMLTPFGSNTPGLNAYVSAVTGTSFTLSVTGSPASGTTYEWFYSLAPTQ